MDCISEGGGRRAYKYLGLHNSLVEAENLVVFVLLESHVGWERALLHIMRVDTSSFAKGRVVGIVRKFVDKRLISATIIWRRVYNSFEPKNSSALGPLEVNPVFSVKIFDRIRL